jgi:hypothetical protein
MYIFKTTGEIHHFYEGESTKSINMLENTNCVNTKNIWKILYENIIKKSNEYDINNLVYCFMKKKAYEILIKLKIQSEKINYNFKEIVEYVKSLYLIFLLRKKLFVFC